MGIQSTMEQAFEDAIVDHLGQSGWLTDTGSSAGWDKARALYVPDVLYWLETQYPEEYAKAVPERSEEHTSELQSRGHLVCRLLLEKKKEIRYEKDLTIVSLKNYKR